VGEREGGLKNLIDKYKFERGYAAYKPLAELLVARIGTLPPDCTLVPIPTISKHIRVRGYDHALLLARQLGRLQGRPVRPLLRRKGSAVQHKATRRQRIIRAKNAFEVKFPLRADTTYVLIDDVYTTGATLEYAAETLLNAGARKVWAAVVARQPLDEL